MIDSLYYCKENKHIGIHDQLPAAESPLQVTAAPQAPAQPSTSQAGNTKALSPNCELAFATNHSLFNHRALVSEEEMDIVN